jgi:hypothetical protein
MRNSNVDVSTITWEIATYLVTVYQLEILRMKSLCLDYIMVYMVDDRLQSPEVYTSLECIADSILRKAFNDSNYKLLSTPVLETHLKILLLYSAHRHPNVRFFATSWSKRMLNVVPKTLFDSKMISYLLNILLYLDSYDMDSETVTFFKLEYARVL